MMQFVSEFSAFLMSVAPIIGMGLFTLVQMSFERDLKKQRKALSWAVRKIHDQLED